MGMLAIGYANAQSTAPYEGKVGINTDTPSATLNVKSLTGNTTKATKNFELQNGANTKLVTVLDNGNFGILADPQDDTFNIGNLLRFSYWSRSNGLGISANDRSMWARGYNFTSSDGATNYGGFGGYGPSGTLRYYFIGEAYDNTTVKVIKETKNVGIGLPNYAVNDDPTERLDVNGNARLRTLPSVAGGATDKLVVVDNTGVLKTVERSNLINTPEWVYDNSTNQIKLTRSGQDTGFVNNVYFDNRNGNYLNIPKELRLMSRFNSNTKAIESPTYDLPNSGFANTRVLNIAYADQIPQVAPGSNHKQLSLNHLLLDDKTANDGIVNFYPSVSQLTVNENSTRNYNGLYGSVNGVNYFGKGKIDFALSSAVNIAQLHNGTGSRVIGSYNHAISNVTTDLPSLEGTYSYVEPRNTGKIGGVAAANNLTQLRGNANTIENLMGTRDHIQINRDFIGSVENMIGNDIHLEINGDVSKRINNSYGIRIRGLAASEKSNYGIYVGNIQGGKDINHAIHTETGKIRFGDLAQSGAGDRVVYADENGVLKTGGSIAANNGVQTQTTMECNEDNRGKMNFGRISINSKETDAIGFCMKNGDNEFRWYYIYGGASHTVGTNANFGQGL